MNISSIVLNAQRERVSDVRNALQQIPGVEIHAATDEGRLIVTIETDSDSQTAETFDRINVLDGVLSAALVYHQFESDPEKEA